MKAFLFSVCCVLTWMVLLPVALIGGGLSLFMYAACAEFGKSVVGAEEAHIDQPTARMLARQICFYPVRQTLYAGI